MNEWEQWLYMAVQSPYGVVLSIDSADFPLVQQKLYRARRALGDPTLTVLQFQRSPAGNPNELWITKATPKSVINDTGLQTTELSVPSYSPNESPPQ